MKKRKKKKEGQYRKSWDYIKESRNSIFFILGIFIITALIGGLFEAPPLVSQAILEKLKELIELTQGLNTFELIVFIFFNNLWISFVGLILGFLAGVVPFFIAASNGYVLGFVSRAVVQEEGFLELWKLLPHGIFELSAVIISLGLGVKLGMFIFTKNPGKEFKKRFFEGIRVFFLVIIPLLFFAAIIEGLLIYFFG